MCADYGKLNGITEHCWYTDHLNVQTDAIHYPLQEARAGNYEEQQSFHKVRPLNTLQYLYYVTPCAGRTAIQHCLLFREGSRVLGPGLHYVRSLSAAVQQAIQRDSQGSNKVEILHIFWHTIK